MSAAPLVAYLVCDSPDRNHDCDFARVRPRRGAVRRRRDLDRRRHEYADTARLDAADLLVSYTAGLQVNDAECQAVRRFLERGGRWFALHGTNAGVQSSDFADLVGSRFMAHPPYGQFAVSIRKPSDPLLAGLEHVPGRGRALPHPADARGRGPPRDALGRRSARPGVRRSCAAADVPPPRRQGRRAVSRPWSRQPNVRKGQPDGAGPAATGAVPGIRPCIAN